MELAIQKRLIEQPEFEPKRKKKKEEALTVQRFINEVLVSQLSIPLRQIVNDTTFSKYTFLKRPDLLVSEFEYDQITKNETQFIENLVAYAEAKDESVVGDADWKDAIKQGFDKAPKLKLPFFIVTNCKTSIFYNVKTRNEIRLNGNPIRTFQTIDVLRLVKNQLTQKPELENIVTNVDSLALISEAVFANRLWELAKVYRNISFENGVQKIDFTIGFISLEYFEERENLRGTKDATRIYWTDCQSKKSEEVVASLSKYIQRLEQNSQFEEFSTLMEKVRIAIVGTEKTKPIVTTEDVKSIYDIIDSMKPLHGCGFDLFGAVYEKFASKNEKKDFGEYFTRRHYTHIFAKLLLKDETYYDGKREFKVLDPACGTGGFLTESFKVLYNAYSKNLSLDEEALRFLEESCFYGFDVRPENIWRTKLNMFLVGDGHTHMYSRDSLRHKFKDDEKWDYILTNPPVGAGTVKADTTAIASFRNEIAFLYRIINLLKVNGKACVLLPDGVLENPSFVKLRSNFLEKCAIEAIISLPKFAFAPYTKEKMYAVFFKKKADNQTRMQTEPIWMYILDNDGLANSDKRFPTKLRNNRNGWMHDEISGWVSTDGEEMPGLLEERWKKFDDSLTSGTEWIDEKGKGIKLRKGGFIKMSTIQEPAANYCLLPEYYMRPAEAGLMPMNQWKNKLDTVEKQMKSISNVDFSQLHTQLERIKVMITNRDFSAFQGLEVPIGEVLGYMSGNSGLTEEYRYSQIKINKERKYLILTGSTVFDETMYIHKCPHPKDASKYITVTEGKQVIHVVRKGKAGFTTFFETGDYTINDDAYLLFLKKSSEVTQSERVDYKINLKWLFYEYRNLFLEYSSSSDNGTWNMTDFFDKARIDIPPIEEQELFVSFYDNLEVVEELLGEPHKRIRELLMNSMK